MCYDEAAKKKLASQFRSQLRKVAAELGLQKGQYDLRFNPGGIAVWGEVTLHTDSLYIQVSQDYVLSGLGVLIRTCTSRKDYVGGQNHWLSVDKLKDPKGFVQAVFTFLPHFRK